MMERMSDPSLAFPERRPRQPLSRRGRATILAAPLLAALLAGCAVAPSQAAPVEVTSPAATASVLPDPAVLTAKLRAVSRKGISSVAIEVVTPSGGVLASRASRKPLTPASTMKLMTTMSAVEALGPSTSFATRVVSAGTGRIVLVGGGDPLLTNKQSTSRYKPASLQALAKSTATALKAQGRTSISLGYDASLFSGPTFSPYWKKAWRGYEARVSALEINSGKLSRYRADPKPPLTAAKAFAARLTKAGITVTSISSTKAATGATEIARVTSASLALIIKRTLLISDNVGAETISRHAALANGRPGSFAGAAANVTAWLTAHGLWRTGQRIQDGSGLSPTNRLTVDALAAAMRLALADSSYRAVVAGLPVAAETGTLADRFDDKSERPGRHTVHAKTGTLRGVAGLAGYLTTRDGAVLVFAELANSSQSVSYERLYNWLDRSAAATARCGCH
jgi:serine-type D-Ala-D-Ala carboxypeptidase/endopeptidase (penicillin-binding protein 4)